MEQFVSARRTRHLPLLELKSLLTAVLIVAELAALSFARLARTDVHPFLRGESIEEAKIKEDSGVWRVSSRVSWRVSRRVSTRVSRRVVKRKHWSGARICWNRVMRPYTQHQDVG